MLVKVVLPFVDLRSFSEEGRAYRLKKPVWPVPIMGSEFVRHFGAVRRRPGGGIDPWAGEQYYCDASRAIVFDKRLSAMTGVNGLSHRSRRLFTSGIVGRGELDFHCPASNDSQGVAAAVGKLKVRVGKGRVQNLISSGGSLTSEYATASRPLKLEGPPVPHLVVSGLPLIVLEQRVVSPAERHTMRRAKAEVAMDHSWSNVDDSDTALWSIQHRWSARADDVRRARRHAVRFHCEIEAFILVLRAAQMGQLDIETSPKLREYLYQSARRLLKGKFDGLPQAEVIRSIAASRRREHEGELSSLQETFRSVSPGGIRVLKEANQLVAGVTVKKPNMYQTNGGPIVVNNIKIGKRAKVQGVVGNNNTVSGSNFVDSPTPDIAALVSLMMAQLRELEPQLPGGELHLGEIVEEVVSQERPVLGRIGALLNSILDGVKKIGEAGVPVADTIGKIIDILPG